MNGFANNIISLALLLSSIIYAQDSVSVSIETNTAKAQIYLNDHFVGFGCIDTTIVAGCYSIKITEGARLYDPYTVIDTVRFAPSIQPMHFAYKIPEPFILRTEPENAYVFDDSLHIGYTPMSFHSIPENLVLSLTGYQQRSIQTYKVQSMLPISLKKISIQRQKAFHETPLFPYLLGGVVVLGGISAYFKIKADNHFEDYQKFGNTEDLEMTDTYDIISGVSFGLLQVNFGYLLYRLLLAE